MAELMRFSGTVKWYNFVKGYGFIDRDNAKGDVFVQHSSIVSDDKYKRLADGDRVEFSIRESREGSHAFGVTRI